MYLYDLKLFKIYLFIFHIYLLKSSDKYKLFNFPYRYKCLPSPKKGDIAYYRNLCFILSNKFDNAPVSK